ncbi:hypothetical protein MVLG_03943 [Microbotryum lychnidis-dioicae p1A1 Lamole]|uniref:BZIP domain-containing protein n=1 Tax=Microbotryum lychnidis-dioicae (strain p1A1 Lamole / MvSl-1064) TaxID=683840 RepID=U5H9Q4_USTV1|nr:hypothetical protein MVLG_03943 [Microbotryum lychnidis-dioicae p1A1 Lamole]|eukprot:KDE05709.1 hypothetical protein MVLG_03943 [Microbotryum lychnidis-dioicae p1A1 Lamole]
MYPFSAMLHPAHDEAAVHMSSRASAAPRTSTTTNTNMMPDSIASVTKLAFGGLNMDMSLDCSHSNAPTSASSASGSSSPFSAASPYFGFPMATTLGEVPTGAFATQQQQQLDLAPAELFFQFDYGDSKAGDDVTQTFMQNFMNMPMDKPVSGFGSTFTSNALAAPLPPFDPFVLPEVLAPEARKSPRQTALSFDQGLDSPLGFDSPASEAAGGLFDEEDLDELPPLDFDSFVQEPAHASVVPSPSSATSQQASIETPFDLSFPSTFAAPSTTSSTLTPTSSYETIAPTPSTSTNVPQPTTRTRRTKATGFRGVHTKLTALDAPIQQRTYVVPSVTARKRKTMAVERELAKRLIVEIKPLKKEVEVRCEVVSSTLKEETESTIPEDLVEAVEKKRLQNTLSARKSRQRKQERLAELEERNVELEVENKRLEERVKDLERRLAMAGLF